VTTGATSGAQPIGPHLLEERTAAVTTIRIDREERLGALSRPMIDSLGENLERIRTDRSVRALILTGAGRGFIAGADINEYSEANQAAFDDYQRTSRRVFDQLASLPIPTIAAVNGYALGGGFEIALSCDFIVASKRARFGLPEIKLGLLPGGGGTQRLSRAIGTRPTKELVMTGRMVDADELDRSGLLTGLHDPDELLPAAMDLAHQLAEAAPIAVREAKVLIDGGVDASFDTAWTLEQRVLSALFASEDAKEGVAAFVDKRTPHFVGR
jgi:enoyl-CoA hydratase